MTNNELVCKIYMLIDKRNKMSIEERCELQKCLKTALGRDIPNEDKEGFMYHVNKFEQDIFEIVNRRKENSLNKLAQMQIALNRLTDEIKSI